MWKYILSKVEKLIEPVRILQEKEIMERSKKITQMVNYKTMNTLLPKTTDVFITYWKVCQKLNLKLTLVTTPFWMSSWAEELAICWICSVSP